MRATRTWTATTAVILLSALVGACHGATQPEGEPAAPAPDAPGDFALDASFGGGMHGSGVCEASIRVDGDGGSSVTFTFFFSWRSAGESTLKATQPLTLTKADVDELSARIERSGYFGTWPEREGYVTDQDTWIVNVRSGGRTKARHLYAQAQFGETERFLRRAIDQAVAEYALASERTDVLADLFHYERSAERVLHVEPVIAALRAIAVHGARPAASAEALVTLRNLVPADEFGSLVRDALNGADDARRRTIVAALVDRGAIAAPLRQRDVVLPYALAEMERSWRGWDGRDAAQAELLRDCASALVWCHETRAVPVFERMVVELSTPERPLVLAPLAAMGDAAVDSLVRLADDGRSELRFAAARMCEGLACELISHSACARPPGADPDVALAPFRESLVPRLERLADGASEDERTRRAAAEALAAIRARPAPDGWKWHRLDWN